MNIYDMRTDGADPIIQGNINSMQVEKPKQFHEIILTLDTGYEVDISGKEFVELEKFVNEIRNNDKS